MKVTVAEPEVELVTKTEVGASGTVEGTTLDDAVEAVDANNPLFAVTANV
jgi:hypothetical protein